MTSLSIPATSPITSISSPTWGDRVFLADWGGAFLVWISVVQAFYLLSILWTLVYPLAGSGALDLLDIDLNRVQPIGTYAIAGGFVFSIFASLRTQKVSLRYVLVLLGQFFYTLVVMRYALQGKTPLVGLGVHGGLFFIHLVAVLSISSSQYRRLKFARLFLMPATSLTFAVIAFGILVSGSRAIASFMGSEHQEPFVIGLFFAFLASAGLVCLNHIHPLMFFVCSIPQIVYTVTVCVLLYTETTTSVAGLVGNMSLLVALFFISLIQMQQYTRSHSRG